ncbi:MAG TPA: RodZ domain-containing protein [Alphaproteobacteria bacterium]|nr:RodZ domain-containing protein [Alphaproteobacteria bacterium]
MAQGKRKLTIVAEPELAGREPAYDGEAGQASVAAILRQARQRTGYGLRDVSATLRIRHAYLEAIEDGRFNDLPGSVYAVGFIRTYAEFLELDGDEVVRRFKNEVAGIDAQTELNFPAPVPEGRMPGGALILLALLLAVGAYGGWYYLSSKDQTVADLVPDLPERFAALLGSEPAVPLPAAPLPAGTMEETVVPETPAATEPPAAIPDAGPTSTVEAPSGDMPAVVEEPMVADVVPPALEETPEPVPTAPAMTTEAPAPAPETDAPLPAEESLTASGPVSPEGPAADETAPVVAESSPAADDVAALPPPPAPPAVPEEAAPAAVEPSSTGIVVTATDQSWVQVRDADGTLVMTRVMEPGEVYEVPDVPGLRMVTGNAGGIRITVDGDETPSLGEPGDVVRNIALDGGRLLSGNAVAR